MSFFSLNLVAAATAASASARAWIVERLGEAGRASEEKGERLPSVLDQTSDTTAMHGGGYTPGSAFKRGTIIINTGSSDDSARKRSSPEDRDRTAAILWPQQED